MQKMSHQRILQRTRRGIQANNDLLKILHKDKTFFGRSETELGYRELVHRRMIVIGHAVQLETDDLMFLIPLHWLALKIKQQFDITLIVGGVVALNHFHYCCRQICWVDGSRMSVNTMHYAYSKSRLCSDDNCECLEKLYKIYLSLESFRIFVWSCPKTNTIGTTAFANLCNFVE